MNTAWDVLGIARTDDKRAIKRAYAAKLKALDVENDPKGFIALREALDHANWEAECGPYDDHWAEDSVADDAAAPISDVEVLSEQPAGETHDEPDEEADEDPAYWRWEPERQPATEADQERIVQLLWGDAPVEEIQVELSERTHAILAAPEMENIDHAGGVEDWMASIIVQSIPRSDVMARIATPHFGWNTQADSWRQRYGVEVVAARFADLEAIDRLEKPDHRWHEAWQLLKQPPPDGKGWKQIARNKSAVVGLLESIRFHSPKLESELNADHVARWETSLAPPAPPVEKEGGFSWWWIVWVLFILAQCARIAGSNDPQPASRIEGINATDPFRNLSNDEFESMMEDIRESANAAQELRIEQPRNILPDAGSAR